MVKSRPCERCAGGRFHRALPVACKSGSRARTAVAVGESYLSRLLGVYSNVDRFVAPSRFLASTLTRMGLPSAALDVLPNPIRLGAEEAAPAEFRTDVLYVGRLSSEKGPDLLLRACERLAGLRVTFVGDGPMLEDLSSYATQHGISATFVGWESREAVRNWMCTSRVLCVPSVCYENCPGVALEGMEAGVPVVASDLGGLPELLERGRCGDLVAPGDERAWAAAIEARLASDADRVKNGRRARQRLRLRHDPDAHTAALIRTYRSVLRARNGRRRPPLSPRA